MSGLRRRAVVVFLSTFFFKVLESRVASEMSDEEFFFENRVPFFDSPTTRKPKFDEDVEQFFGVKDESKLFKQEKDVFEKMKNDEAFFFKKESEGAKGKQAEDTESGKVNAQVTTQHSRLCTCEDVVCRCCSSMKIFGKEKFKGCLEFEYVARDFAIYITLTINGRIIVTRILSGRNPLPFCATTPYVPLVSFCIRLYDIHHNPKGLSLCVRLEVVSMRQILFSLSFDCIKIDEYKMSFYMPPNATTFGVVGLHLGDTDPYVSYQDWTKLHFPLPQVTTPPPANTKPKTSWFSWIPWFK